MHPGHFEVVSDALARTCEGLEELDESSLGLHSKIYSRLTTRAAVLLALESSMVVPACPSSLASEAVPFGRSFHNTGFAS